MGRYADIMMERQDSFRGLLEEICELCGLKPDLSAGTLRQYAAGYACTAEELSGQTGIFRSTFQFHPLTRFPLYASWPPQRSFFP